jgi:hypothetical protein
VDENMSDNKDLDQIIKSLNTTPDEEAKREAKAVFLQKTEEIKKMNETERTIKVKPKFKFWINRQAILSFATGMVAMLILVIGVTTAVNPSFLAGTVINKTELTRYRMFPSKVNIPDINSKERYLSELMILFTPEQDFKVEGNFSLCDGRNISINNYSALFSVLNGEYGFHDIFTYGFPVNPCFS